MSILKKVMLGITGVGMLIGNMLTCVAGKWGEQSPIGKNYEKFFNQVFSEAHAPISGEEFLNDLDGLKSLINIFDIDVIWVQVKNIQNLLEYEENFNIVSRGLNTSKVSELVEIYQDYKNSMKVCLNQAKSPFALFRTYRMNLLKYENLPLKEKFRKVSKEYELLTPEQKQIWQDLSNENIKKYKHSIKLESIV